MVVVNLYPFKEVAEKTTDEAELIKNIDIGGCALLRAAAKNNKNVLAVSSPAQYEKVLNELESKGGLFGDEISKEFAQKAFAVEEDSLVYVLKIFAKKQIQPHKISGFELHKSLLQISEAESVSFLQSFLLT